MPAASATAAAVDGQFGTHTVARPPCAHPQLDLLGTTSTATLSRPPVVAGSDTMAIWNAAEPLYRTVGFDHGPNPGMPIRLRPDGPRRPGRPGLGCLREEDTDDAVALGLARSGAGVQTGLSLLWRLGSGSVTGLVSAVRVASRTPSCQGSAGRLLARNPSRPARGHQSGQPGPAKQAPRGQPEAEKMIATSNLFRFPIHHFRSRSPSEVTRAQSVFSPRRQQEPEDRTRSGPRVVNRLGEELQTRCGVALCDGLVVGWR